VSRDGGHFEAQFARGAEAFADEAGRLLRASLPGLRVRISIDGEPLIKSQGHVSTGRPVLAPCEWPGRGLASDIATQGSKGDEDYEEHEVSLDAKQRHDASKRAESGKADDIASLLSS